MALGGVAGLLFGIVQYSQWVYVRDQDERLREVLKLSEDKNLRLNEQARRLRDKAKRLEEVLAMSDNDLRKQNYRLQINKDEADRRNQQLRDEILRLEFRKTRSKTDEVIHGLQERIDKTATYICINCDIDLEADDAEYAECSNCGKEVVACSECVADDVICTMCFTKSLYGD